MAEPRISRHITSRTRTTEDDKKLVALASVGATVLRASAALKRSQVAVKARAKRIGVELKGIKQVRDEVRHQSKSN